jgi:Uma2 family endonuclease
MTLDDWYALDRTENGEIVDGFLVDEEEADFAHALAVAWIIATLGRWTEPRGGLVAASRAKFVVAQDRGRKPDATVYLASRPPTRGLIRVPPTIAVEVVGPTPKDAKRDRVEKLGEYAAFGIAFYWIVDPQLRTLEVLELGSDRRYVHALAASDGILSDVPGCPDLTIDLDDLWRYLDENTRSP